MKMNKRPLRLSMALVLLPVFAVSIAGAQQKQKTDNKKDVVKATKTMKATFVGFETGDYIHAILKNAKGEEVTMFLGSPGVDFFLALHVNRPLTITYQEVSSYIEEAGGRMDIERISSARFGKLDYKDWYKTQRKKYTFKQMEDKYGPLVHKLEKNGGSK